MAEEQVDDDAQELHEHVRLVVDPGQQPERIDKYIVNHTERISRNKIQNAAEAGYLLVNGQPVKSNYKTRPNDIVTIVLPKEVEHHELLPEDIPLNIVYEDEHVLVVNKPAGLVVHPGVGNYTGTMANALAHHFKDLKQSGLDRQRPGIVHRIDKLTSGLLVVAKNEAAHTHLAQQFFEKSVNRRYEAIVWGSFDEPLGTITGNIGRSLKNRKKYMVFPEGEAGKHAVTHYEVLEDLGYVSRIECRLETGRTHQIRVHMRYINHPLFGDPDYDGDKIVKGTVYTKYRQFVTNCFKLLPRQALHARTLGFEHPETGKKMEFHAELPADMQQVLDKWRTYSTHLKQ